MSKKQAVLTAPEADNAQTNAQINIEDRFMLTALRSVGYDVHTAIAELIDNCVDAEATDISIVYEPKSLSMIILDNGIGMSLAKAKKSMDLGADRVYDETEIGYFGAGMKTAILNLLNISDINSKVVILTNDGEYTTRIEWQPVKHVRSYKIERVEQEMERGTKIILSGVYRFQPAVLKKNLGVFFYPVLRTETVNITVNGDGVIGNDPLYRNSEYTQRNFVEAIVQGHSIRIDTSALSQEEPNMHSWETRASSDGETRWSMNKGGLYVMYGGRYIEYGGSLNAFANHPMMNQIRIEFAVPKELTEVFGIKFNKTKGLDLDLKKDANEPLNDLIKKIRDSYAWGVRNRKNKDLSTSEDKQKLQEMTDKLNDAAKKARIDKPKSNVDVKKTPADVKDDNDTPETPTPPQENGQDKPKNTRITKHNPFDIRFSNLGNTAVFWHLGYENNQFVITINDGHVFYTDMWLNMNESAQSSVVFLLASLAHAQYELSKTENIGGMVTDFFWEDFWGHVSMKLRRLHLS
jgi:hypothetical protein